MIEKQKFYSAAMKEDITEKTNSAFQEQDTKVITDTILRTNRVSVWSLIDNYGDSYGDSLDMSAQTQGKTYQRRVAIIRQAF